MMTQLKSCMLLTLAVTFCLVGSCLLLALGFLYLEPYFAVHHLARSVCTVSHYVIQPGYVRCTCFSDSQDCMSQFPCVRVTVEFSSNSHIYKNVTMYDTLRSYELLHSNFKCSIQQCDPRVDRNVQVIENFMLKHRPQSTSTCYHQPYRPEYAILEVVSTATVVHSILWPCVLLAIGTGLLIFVILKTPLFNLKPELQHIGDSIALSSYQYQSMKK